MGKEKKKHRLLKLKLFPFFFLILMITFLGYSTKKVGKRSKEIKVIFMLSLSLKQQTGSIQLVELQNP